ncbi:ATP-NAD kinase family protein [Microvirga pudoricolor]|uniref:ATP-NAD kinase family protein n=1 Tax=Microvirga pudoricolor TaxID=2778729 RepID=UPI002D21C89C|nr:NAD(+)/NADH kinase [Microvirga pudoricolor]
MSMRVGLVINPVAGLGGSVGLKGTDGRETVAEALRRGAVAQAGARARRAVAVLTRSNPGAHLVVAPGEMGAAQVADLPLAADILELGKPTFTAEDTRKAVAAMKGADLILFAGGDGTARDVAAALPEGAGMLGIPCGVKMHSGVFALSPEGAGHLLAGLLAAPERIQWREDAEIMDIDEAALRAGHLSPHLYGYARVPQARTRMQAAKGGARRNSAAALEEAAQAIVSEMAEDVLYIVGPGSSAGAVTKALGFTPTVLGVDAIRNREMVARDATAGMLRELAGEGEVQLVLGVTGQQGFVLGRGNQQIPPDLIRRAGLNGLIILATEEKLSALATPRLWVDTGEPDLDANLAGFVRVRTDANKFMMIRLGSG